MDLVRSRIQAVIYIEKEYWSVVFGLGIPPYGDVGASKSRFGVGVGI